VDVQTHIFLISVLIGGEWPTTRSGHFTVGEKVPGTHWIEDWVDPRAVLDDMEKWKILTLQGLELRHLGRPACNQSPHRLSYRDS
jgi:hypothetical protein